LELLHYANQTFINARKTPRDVKFPPKNKPKATEMGHQVKNIVIASPERN